MTCGPLPVRIWEASSLELTSRCSISICQLPRIHSASWAGEAWRAFMLVIT